jgi:hypothetical protein
MIGNSIRKRAEWAADVSLLDRPNRSFGASRPGWPRIDFD